MKYFDQSAPRLCYKGLKILNFGAVTNSKYKFCSLFSFLFALFSCKTKDK